MQEADEFFDLCLDIERTVVLVYSDVYFYKCKRIHESELPSGAVFCRIRPSTENCERFASDSSDFRPFPGDRIYQTAEVANEFLDYSVAGDPNE